MITKSIDDSLKNFKSVLLIIRAPKTRCRTIEGGKRSMAPSTWFGRRKISHV